MRLILFKLHYIINWHLNFLIHHGIQYSVIMIIIFKCVKPSWDYSSELFISQVSFCTKIHKERSKSRERFKMLNPEELSMNTPWRPGRRHSWPRSIWKKKKKKEPCYHYQAAFFGREKCKGSTQHVPRSMGQNKQCIVGAWKQHSLNMVRPQIRDSPEHTRVEQVWEPGVWISSKGALSLLLQVPCRCDWKAFNWGQLETCNIRV